MNYFGRHTDREDALCECGVSRHPDDVAHATPLGETGWAAILHNGKHGLWMETVLVDTDGFVRVPRKVTAPRHPKPDREGRYPDARK